LDFPKNFKKILITGANGYIGSKLLISLAEKGLHIYALVRSKAKVSIDPSIKNQITLIEGDLLIEDSLKNIPKDLDAAYYLVHSMNKGTKNFRQLDQIAATNFVHFINTTSCQQIIYLGALIHGKAVSKHFSSRLEVEKILQKAKCPVTVLRAGIIIGSGSASYKIIDDLVRKLPIMIAPRWLRSRCQPISIEDVLFYLSSVLGHANCMNQTFEIAGPDILTYKQMLLEVAKIRNCKRWILEVPVLTPSLSSYWLLLVTSTNFSLAKSLVESLRSDAICTNTKIQEIFPRKCLSFQEAIRRAMQGN